MAKITNISTVTSKYSLPDGTQRNSLTNSNTSETENMTLSLLKERSTERNFGLAGDEIKQTIKLTNNSTYGITDVTVTDAISANATYKVGSVYINGTPSPDSDPTAGITLDQIDQSGGEAIITYDLVIDNNPTTDLTSAQATIVYTVAERDNLSEKTNKNDIEIETQSIVIEMNSDKAAVISGDTLTFQNVIKNEGSLPNTDIVFKSELPEELSFISDSVTIDGETKSALDPTTGFPLDDMQPGTTTTVNFSATVR